jgi:hypothetical protein
MFDKNTVPYCESLIMNVIHFFKVATIHIVTNHYVLKYDMRACNLSHLNPRIKISHHPNVIREGHRRIKCIFQVTETLSNFEKLWGTGQS